MTSMTLERPSLALAAEFRAEVARQGMSRRQLAMQLGVTHTWLSTRIGTNPSVDITLEEAAKMADALGISTEGIVLAALRACRDSNPKPSDLESRSGAVRRSLTVNRRNRSAWELAA